MGWAIWNGISGGENPKHEIRKSKQIQMTKIQKETNCKSVGAASAEKISRFWNIGYLDFGFVSDFDIRIYDLRLEFILHHLLL
jgi:hypothetical protein